MIKKLALSFGVLLLVCLAAAGGYFFAARKYSAFISSIHLVRQDDPSYFFVHPIIGLNVPDATEADEFKPLLSKIQNIFSADSNFVDRYSVYFKDLNRGFWIGINEDDTYDPASMLKVALAFAAYKQAEGDPAFLQSQVVYTQTLADINTSIPFADPTELKVGGAYSVDDLIQKMIVDSDNGAKDALGNTVDQNIQKSVYTDLGLTDPDSTSSYAISPEKYTIFFRRLYNSSYLSEDYSNDLLKLLSEATFKDGLVSGVASSTIVSHKYGEHINSADNSITSTELHDCGIVYQTNNPYLLCVMTEGKDESDLASAIAAVSQAVNQEVISGYK